MKHFLIKYRFTTGSPDEWRGHIAQFIAHLNSDPDLKGKISYRCMKERDGVEYYHLASTADDAAAAALQSKDFFKFYSAETRRVAGGELSVVPLEIIGETEHRA
jgi:hypothetical protein